MRSLIVLLLGSGLAVASIPVQQGRDGDQFTIGVDVDLIEAGRIREIMSEEKAENVSTGSEASVPKPHLPNETVARREPSAKL